LSLVATVYTALGFLPTVLNSGQDVYGQSRSVTGALVAAAQLWPFWTSLLIAAYVLYRVLSGKERGLKSWLQIGLGFMPVLMVSSEAFFYQYSIIGGSFTHARYGVVTEFIGLLTIATLVLLASTHKTPKGAMLRNVALGAAALAVLGPLGQLSSSTEYRNSSRANAEYLNAQFSALESTAQNLKTQNIDQVLYLVDEPYDYERINASRQYIAYLSGETKDFFLWTDFTGVQYDQFTMPLGEELSLWSAEGNPAWEILPLDDLKQDSPTLCVHFGKDPVNSPCSQSQWIGG